MRGYGETARALLGTAQPALGDGFVKLVDVMGDDRAVVEAARMSFGGPLRPPAEDRGLLRFLMRHGHSTPFEAAEVKFHCRFPMDLGRQLLRHRAASWVGADGAGMYEEPSANEWSTRYTEAIDAVLRTAPDAWRRQSAANKQGSAEAVADWPDGWSMPGYLNPDLAAELAQAGPGAYLSDREARSQAMAREVYEERLRFGVAREQARKDLPLCTFTEAVLKCDLWNWLHFCGLRLEHYAQAEIRELAGAVAWFLERLFPDSWEAFEDYHPRRQALLLSRPEVALVQAAAREGDPVLTAERLARLGPPDWAGAKNRERADCVAKLRRLGLWRDA